MLTVSKIKYRVIAVFAHVGCSKVPKWDFSHLEIVR